MDCFLEVGPFPEFITKLHKESLLKHFGAIQVIHLKKKLKETYMIGIFSSHQECKYALDQLHQTDIHGKRLIAVYSKRDIDCLQKQHDIKFILNKERSVSQASTLKRNIQNYEAKLSSISAKFDILHPISPLLRYAYPPPSSNALANITHFLVNNPKFYTQVLHLMNKMNLPCPFGKPAPAINKEEKYLSSILNKSNNIDTIEREIHEKSTDSDTEIETDADVRKLFSEKPRKQKRIKRITSKINKKPRIDQLKPSFNTEHKEQRNAADITDIFDSTEINKQKNLQLNLPSTTVSSSTVDAVTTEGFGKIIPVEVKSKIYERKEFITSTEIESNKIDESEWCIVPVFKEYKCGEPTCRLYVKNLAKTVLEQDLKYIFGKYVNWCFPEEVSEFKIKLMKTGRMKGQAFISFQSVKTAVRALEEVNGYILKDKPMVIAYSNRKT